MNTTASAPLAQVMLEIEHNRKAAEDAAGFLGPYSTSYGFLQGQIEAYETTLQILTELDTTTAEPSAA